MQLHTTTVPTPVGPFTLLVDGDGVCAAGFTAVSYTHLTLPTILRV